MMRETHPTILAGLYVLALSCAASAAEPEAGKTNKDLKTAKPKYRVLFNYDSDPVFRKKEPTTPQDVEQMVDDIATGGPDVLLIAAADQRTYFPSKVWQTHWEGYKEGDRSFFGDVPEQEIASRTNFVGNMARLAKQCDYLATALARCRLRGIAPGVSIRMNEMHDAPWPSSHLFSRFYKANPQFQLKPVPGRSWGTKALDYTHPQVREHYLSLIRELAQSYDVEVMELDFMRFPFYFGVDDFDRSCGIMTGFLREVRKTLDATGRPIALIPRIASNPGAARQLGFDVEAWAREGLVDGITPANFLGTCWDFAVEDFRELVGPRVAIYASSEVTADRRDGLPPRYLPESYDMLRGFAAGYLAAGADGINAFNYYLARHHQPVTTEQFYGGLREMRSLAQARDRPRVHVLSTGFFLTECDMPVQLPVTIRPLTERRFEMLLAAAGKGAQVTAYVYFDGETRAEDLWLRIGVLPGGHAVEIRDNSESKPEDKSDRKSKIAVFKIPPHVIKDGRNQLILRNRDGTVTILGIDVDIRGS